MALCTWCNQDMIAATSCTVDVFHRGGRRFEMVPFGAERRRGGPRQCGDCGVGRGGWHHPGCDLQVCPACRRQMISCGCRFDEDSNLDSECEPFGVDGNGVPTERVVLDGVEVIVRRADYPESDMTSVEGIPCTTALRTVIDIAPEVSREELQLMFADFLDRGLFTLDEARRRLSQPDLLEHTGAALVRPLLPTQEWLSE